TVSPEATLEVAGGLARRSIVHMDTPMLGSQPQAISGEIFFIVGGERARLDTITPYLEIMGRLHMYVGPSASGNRVKLLHLDLARAAKVPTPILEETKRTYEEAIADGWGKEDFSAVTHVIEKRIGRKLSPKS